MNIQASGHVACIQAKTLSGHCCHLKQIDDAFKEQIPPLSVDQGTEPTWPQLTQQLLERKTKRKRGHLPVGTHSMGWQREAVVNPSLGLNSFASWQPLRARLQCWQDDQINFPGKGYIG